MVYPQNSRSLYGTPERRKLPKAIGHLHSSAISLLRSLMPSSLQGRTAIILVLPIVVMYLIIATSFIQRTYENVTAQMTNAMALEIAMLSQDHSNFTALVRQAASLNLIASKASSPVVDHQFFYDLSGRVVTHNLHKRLPDLIGVDLANVPGRVRLSVNTSFGIVDLNFSRHRVTVSNPHQMLVLMTFTAGLMTLLAYWFLRQQLLPIRQLADVSEAFGRGKIQAFRPAGASEVHSAGHSFLTMRDRIVQQKEQRTLLLSGVSHDLRTPMTRMKLCLGMSDDTPENRELLYDLVEMERLINSFLNFIRDASSDAREVTDVAELIGQTTDATTRAGLPIKFEIQADSIPKVSLCRDALRRALDNLVGNAARYGTKAIISASVEENTLRLRVEDDGPGIEPKNYAESLKPFVRLDKSRNQDKGCGVGPGLTIAADAAVSHGGEIVLGRSEKLGGLCVDLVVPV